MAGLLEESLAVESQDLDDVVKPVEMQLPTNGQGQLVSTDTVDSTTASVLLKKDKWTNSIMRMYTEAQGEGFEEFRQTPFQTNFILKLANYLSSLNTKCSQV